MGVMAIQFYQGLTRDTKPTFFTNANGSCCAVFTGTIGRGFTKHLSQSMDVGFSGYDFKEMPDLFSSRLIQSLVPGTTFVARPGQTIGDKQYPHGTIHVPFWDVPADQVSCVLRMAKCWIANYHVNSLRYIQKHFPELSPPDQAALAMIADTYEADSDGGVCFFSGTCKSIYEGGSFSSGHAFTTGSILELLKGNTRPGKQPVFQENGYFKAGWVRSYVGGSSSCGDPWLDKARKAYTVDDEPTANLPVIIRSKVGPKVAYNRAFTTVANIFKDWLSREGINLVEEIAKGNPLVPASAETIELPTGGDASSTEKPVSTAPSSSSPSQPSSTRSSNPEIDWSVAPRGAQRAFVVTRPLHRVGSIGYVKRSRTTGIYYWHHGGEGNNWVAYRDQEAGAVRYASATPKPRTRRPQVTEEQRERWSRAPAGATHYSFETGLGSRWLRIESGMYYYLSGRERGSWVPYYGPQERWIHHFNNAETRPAGL